MIIALDIEERRSSANFFRISSMSKKVVFILSEIHILRFTSWGKKVVTGVPLILPKCEQRILKQ